MFMRLYWVPSMYNREVLRGCIKFSLEKNYHCRSSSMFYVVSCELCSAKKLKGFFLWLLAIAFSSILVLNDSYLMNEK